jgi:hypothetical protein
LIFTMSDSTNPPITVAHVVQNQTFNALLNLTQVCAINYGSNIQLVEVSGFSFPFDFAGSLGDECSFDISCGIGNDCFKTSSAINGICIPNCSFDTECGVSGRCAKTRFSLDGICIPD